MNLIKAPIDYLKVKEEKIKIYLSISLLFKNAFQIEECEEDCRYPFYEGVRGYLYIISDEIMLGKRRNLEMF